MGGTDEFVGLVGKRSERYRDARCSGPGIDQGTCFRPGTAGRTHPTQYSLLDEEDKHKAFAAWDIKWQQWVEHVASLGK